MVLENIVPWGRTYEEYTCMFRLREGGEEGRVLDVGGGPASFCAESAAAGHDVVAMDPLYAFSGAAIRARFDSVVDTIMSQVRAKQKDWVWTFHRDPNELQTRRRHALERFLKDYDLGLLSGRYRVAELPRLPLRSGEFDLALCSHLLFLYSDQLSFEFHVESLAELCRVAKEVRIFPLLTLAGISSPYLPGLQGIVRDWGWEWSVEKVDYELQRGGNHMLRLFRTQA